MAARALPANANIQVPADLILNAPYFSLHASETSDAEGRRRGDWRREICDRDRVGVGAGGRHG